MYTAQDLARAETPLPAGATVGPYRIIELLARGGMGDVYRATDIRLHRDVAVKMLARAALGHPQQVDRFLQEARVTASLEHPNIVRIYDVGFETGQPYLVEELLDGETLRSRLARENTIDTLHAILHDPAPDVLQKRDDVPSALAVIVKRLLAKSPDARFQSAADLVWSLEQVAITPTPSSNQHHLRSADSSVRRR